MMAAVIGRTVCTATSLLLRNFPYTCFPARCVSITPVTSFYLTNIMSAEPLKKKRKVDPAIVKMREDRKKRKIEKAIRRLQKLALQLKPVDELMPNKKLLQEKQQRTRQLPELSFEESERRALLQKEWARYKYTEVKNELQAIDYLVASQQKALDELRLESEELYQQAIMLDDSLLHFEKDGPVKTPPMPGYDSPDGDYIDQTKSWD